MSVEGSRPEMLRQLDAYEGRPGPLRARPDDHAKTHRGLGLRLCAARCLATPVDR